MAVDQAGVGQRPQVLGGLQFGRVRREEEQVDMVGHTQLHAGVPSGAIEDQHNLLARTRAHLAGKFRQFDFKERNADRRRQMKDGPARGGMDKADQVAPGLAVLHPRHRALAYRRPDPPQQRFQADPMFISRPQLDAGMRKRRRHLPEQWP